MPPATGPVALRGLVPGEHVQVSLIDARGLESIEASSDQSRSNSPSAEARLYGEVLQIAAAAVMPTHHAANHSPACPGDETHARIARKISLRGFARIGGAPRYSRGGFKQDTNRIVI